MEKTMARAIYKKMEVGKIYTTHELRNLIGDDYYKYVPADMHPGAPNGFPVNKGISNEMWKIVNAGFAKTFTGKETLPNVKGLKYGATPTSFQTYNFRYWVRIK